MKFYSNKISMKPISLEDAVKKIKEQPKARSLEEILADIKSKQTPIAQAPQLAKTAAAQSAKVEKTAGGYPPKVEAAKTTATIKVAEELRPAKPAEKKPDPKPEAKKATSNKLVMKLAKELDFRDWEAQQVVDAWSQHGSVAKCIANVKGKASNPETYCKLLQTAGGMAEKTIKVAKVASAKKPAEFKKFAKLTPDEEARLRKYFTKYYGKDYVDALLGDY
jgi:hypothetical protein